MGRCWPSWPRSPFYLTPLQSSRVDEADKSFSLRDFPACLPASRAVLVPNPLTCSDRGETGSYLIFPLRSVSIFLNIKTWIVKHLPHHRTKGNSCGPWKWWYFRDDDQKTEGHWRRNVFFLEGKESWSELRRLDSSGQYHSVLPAGPRASQSGN